jgi:hypothetical protein
MFQPTWPSSGVALLLCGDYCVHLVLYLVLYHICTGVSFSDVPLSPYVACAVCTIVVDIIVPYTFRAKKK